MRPDAGSDNGPAPRKRKERTKDGRLRKRTAIFVFSAVGSGNGFSERADACRSGVRGRDGAVRRRCVRIAGRGRVLRTGTKGGLYAGGTFPGVGSVRAVVTGGGGRPMGKGRKSRKKDGRLPVGRKGPSRGSPSREACRVKPEIGPGKTKSGKDLRFGVRPFAADAFYGGLAVSRLPAGGSDIGVFPPVFCRFTRKSRHGAAFRRSAFCRGCVATA